MLKRTDTRIESYTYTVKILHTINHLSHYRDMNTLLLFLLFVRLFCQSSATKVIEASKKDMKTTPMLDSSPDNSTGSPITGDKDCCQNGGRCIMGSFCFCLKGFYGRYCQFHYGHKQCGGLQSGQMIRSDCNLCQCFDGKFMCLPNVFPGCESADYQDADSINPLVGKNIETVPGGVDHRETLPNFRMDDDHLNHEDYFVEYEDVVSSVSRNHSDVYTVMLFMLIFLANFTINF